MKILVKIIAILIVIALPKAFAQKKKINYKYKTYEKFDFEKMNISGDKSSPGDLSISSRVKEKFKNKIPKKPNLIPEMKASVDAVL